MIGLKAILVIVLLISVAAGQGDAPRTYPQRVADGLRATVTSPAIRWHWAATGVGILLALPFDDNVKAVRNDLMSNRLASFGYEWGGKWAALTILPGIYLTENIRGTSRETTFQRLEFAFTSLTMVGITTEVIKYVVRRERPNHQPTPPFPYGHSFPSGHASAAFGVAEVIRTLYGGKVGAVFYGIAVITGLSRIHDNKHYLSDVVAGAGLGIGLVRGFSLAQRPAGGTDNLRITISSQTLIIGINF